MGFGENIGNLIIDVQTWNCGNAMLYEQWKHNGTIFCEDG